MLNGSQVGMTIVKSVRGLSGKITDFTYSWLNKAANEMAGEDVIGKHMLVLYPHVKEIGLFDAYVDTIENGRQLDFEEYYSPHQKWFRWSGNKCNDGLVIMVEDITKRKKLEQQRDDFISIASHELRTPVTSIKAYAEMIGDILLQTGDAANASLMQKLNGQVDRLATLIHALLDTTKLSQGQLALHPQSFDLSRLIDERMEELRHTWQTHRLTVQHSGTLTLTADRERISQVLINLVSNAVKYSPPGSSVLITSKQAGEHVQVCVQDEGIGIPKDALKKVFDRFYRAGGQRSHTVQGMGLGLYITAGIVRRHGGTIWAESGMGKGSRFCFTLPLIALQD